MKLRIDSCSAFFFDFDGVICDSVNIKTEAFEELYRSCGEEAVLYVSRHHKEHGGMSRFLKIRHYHKELLGKDLSEDELKALTDKFSALVLKKVIAAPFIKGAVEFIETLHKKDKKIFLVSGTPEEEIRNIMKAKKLNSYFLEVKGAPVSKKDNLQYLLESYRIQAPEAAFFGDSAEDQKAASSLGMRFIPINYYERGLKGFRDFMDFMNKEMKEEN